jgi:nucleotidyltransferase substrate binding protein (TIGR01987 family)
MRLGTALDQPQTEFVRDAAIQRFKFSFEVGWKSVQVIARFEAQDCPSPRMAITTAWRNGWVTDEELWLDMLDERNKTSHTYRESMAQEVFDELPRYLAPLQALHTSLVSRLNEIEAAPSGA